MMNDEVAMGSPSLRRKERFIMMSLETLNKMKWEKSVLQTLEHAIRMASSNQLNVYPYDKVYMLDAIEGIPYTAIEYTLDDVCGRLELEYTLDNGIQIWNSAKRKKRLLASAETVKERMIDRVELEQKRFIDASNRTIFTCSLNETGDYYELAKEIFEPLGFVVSKDDSDNLWVNDPEYAKLIQSAKNAYN
jgi:hypothetical protein